MTPSCGPGWPTRSRSGDAAAGAAARNRGPRDRDAAAGRATPGPATSSGGRCAATPRASRRCPTSPALPPDAALDLAQQLIDSGRAFRAHEVLEASWKAAPPAERDLWQGLAQVAVGLTHAQRGNARGAAALLRRGGRRVAGYAAAAAARGRARRAVARFAAELADLIERRRASAAGATPAALRVSLRSWAPGG